MISCKQSLTWLLPENAFIDTFCSLQFCKERNTHLKFQRLFHDFFYANGPSCTI